MGQPALCVAAERAETCPTLVAMLAKEGQPWQSHGRDNWMNATLPQGRIKDAGERRGGNSQRPVCRLYLTRDGFFEQGTLNIKMLGFPAVRQNSSVQSRLTSMLLSQVPCLPHFLVMILRYCNALRAAATWAWSGVSAVPKHTASGSDVSWTRHWCLPSGLSSSMGT